MTIKWRTSTRSQSNAGQCVEIGGIPGGVAIRDSKDKTGPVLTCDRATWAGFITDLSLTSLPRESA